MDQEQPQLTKRERKLLRRQERADESARSSRPQSIRRWVSGLVVVVVVGGGGVGYIAMSRTSATSNSETYTAAPVHWHATLSMSTCGVSETISDLGDQNLYEGLPLLHTHGDDRIHVEGRIIKAEDISLGRFFDSINIPFDTDRFMDKQGTDACNDGSSDSLHVTVNGSEIPDPRNYVVKDGDQINVRFE